MKRKYKTLIVNLATGEEQIYVNELGSIENLITAYLTSIKHSHIQDVITRDKYRAKVLYGKRTASLGDYAVSLLLD